MLIIFWKTKLKAVVNFGECAQSIRSKLSKILEYAQNVFVSCMAHKQALMTGEGDDLVLNTPPLCLPQHPDKRLITAYPVQCFGCVWHATQEDLR